MANLISNTTLRNQVHNLICLTYHSKDLRRAKASAAWTPRWAPLSKAWARTAAKLLGNGCSLNSDSYTESNSCFLSIYSEISTNSTAYKLPLLNEFLFYNTNKFLIMKLLAIVFSILLALFISFICDRKFCIEFNLIVSAITFFIMGIDESVKFFAICE